MPDHVLEENCVNTHRTLLALCLSVAALTAQAQQPDMNIMMKWAKADLVRYHVVGVYQDRTYIASDGSGRADVSDRVVIDLTIKLSEMKLVGTPTFQNFKTVVSNVADFEPKCLPPVLEGEYEHFELLSIKEGLGVNLQMQVQRKYPVVGIVQVCTGSRKPVPAKTETRPEEFGVISPMMFALPLPDSDNLRVSADKKSLISKKNGWTWTFTPTIAAGK